jgi:hypothetical protein
VAGDGHREAVQLILHVLQETVDVVRVVLTHVVGC